MKNYRIKVKHDNGSFIIRTAASSKEAAKQIVMNAEGCPQCAIVWVKAIKR